MITPYHVSEANTKRAIEKNRRELVGLQITYSRLEKDCKEKCAFVDVERAHFLKHKHTIPRSHHNKGPQLLPTRKTLAKQQLNLFRKRKSGKFKILDLSVMTLSVLNSINDSTRLEALDLPFNEHIVKRKIQSEKDLRIKLNQGRNLRYLKSGRNTTR